MTFAVYSINSTKVELIDLRIFFFSQFDIKSDCEDYLPGNYTVNKKGVWDIAVIKDCKIQNQEVEF